MELSLNCRIVADTAKRGEHDRPQWLKVDMKTTSMKWPMRLIPLGMWAMAAAGLLAASQAADRVLVEAESFANPGGWSLDTQFIEIMGSPYLLAHGLGRPVADATTTVHLPRLNNIECGRRKMGGVLAGAGSAGTVSGAAGRDGLAGDLRNEGKRMVLATGRRGGGEITGGQGCAA